MKTLISAAALALMPVAALAHDGMHVEDAYGRSTNPANAALFMRLENHRAVACTLTAVRTDAAKRAELHTHSEADGIMRMGRIEGGITVAPGTSHALMRGGDHVMLMGLTRPLADGDVVTLELDFGACGTETAEVTVDNSREDAGMPGTHQGH